MHLQNQEWAGHNVLPIHWPHRSDCVWNTAVWFIIHLQTGRVTHIVLVCVYKLPVVLSMMQNITNVYLHCNSVHRLTWKSSSPTHNFFFFLLQIQSWRPTALEQLQYFPPTNTYNPAPQLMVTSFMKLDQVGVIDPCQVCINYSTAVWFTVYL